MKTCVCRHTGVKLGVCVCVCGDDECNSQTGVDRKLLKCSATRAVQGLELI